jgi:hypothetical protein
VALDGRELQPDLLTRLCFGSSLATLAAKGLLIWSTNRFYDLSAVSLQGNQPEAIGPASILVSVMAIAGLSGAVWAFIKGARGQMLYASIVFNSVALLANPIASALN